MKHSEVVMERLTLEDLPSQALNPWFTIRGYQAGDETAWSHIQTEADHYNTITPELFLHEFGTDPSEHKRRVLFAQAPNRELIGTSTAWWGSSPQDEWGRVHWVAVLPTWQRQGIGRALLVATCHRLRDLGHMKAFLTTSAVRVEALSLYRSLGFVPRSSSPNSDEQPHL